MTPLRVVAELEGPICLAERPIALDALLMAAACAINGVAPALVRDDLVTVEIPIERSNCGRYYLASVGEYAAETYSLRYLTKRAPVEQFQTIGSSSIKRVDITSGVNKSYRLPLETTYLVDDRIVWWCIGELSRVQGLLTTIHHLGKKRSVGLGKVRAWTVDEVAETWPGFPTLRDGLPMRNLPLDAHGLVADADQAYAVLSPPYWLHEMEELCAVPRCHR